MSQIEKLIVDFCPDGVKYVPLSTVADVGTGSSNRNESTGQGTYPFYVRSKTVYLTDEFEFDEEAIIIPGEGGIGEIFHFASGKYALHQRAYRIHIHASELHTKFILFYMKSNFKKFILTKAVSATVTSIRKPMILDFKVPVPPLEVQKEIVRILDTFTQLEAELEAELEARKKQYEHYRNTLLGFKNGDVRWLPLGEVVVNLDSKRKPVTKSSREPGPYPYYGANGIQDYVSGFIFDETLLLVGEDGSVIRPDGTPYVHWSEGKVWVNNHAHVLTPKDTGLNLRFLYHFLQTVQISEFVTGGSQLKINQGNLNKILVPLPEKEIQDDVALRLDAMHEITHGLTSGLPAEIAARRKQYEHYRDKLLTFKEFAA